jgi:hypothetical protein
MELPTAEAPPTLAKRYRARYRCNGGSVCYESVRDVEGYALLFVGLDGSMDSTMITGLCGPCMFAAERNRPACGLGDQCPRVKSEARNAKLATPRERPAPAAISAPVAARATTAPAAEPDTPAAPTVSRDPQYEPYRVPRDTAASRRLSWGPGNI